MVAHVKNGVGNPERSFGVSVGAALCVLALVLLWRGRPVRAEIMGAVGALVLLCGLVYPPILARPSALWWRFSRALGQINTRVLLTLLFFAVLVPLSIIWRLTGKDPLARRRDRWPGWWPYPASHLDRGHYTRMY
jgi:hypothetical protein